MKGPNRQAIAMGRSMRQDMKNRFANADYMGTHYGGGAMPMVNGGGPGMGVIQSMGYTPTLSGAGRPGGNGGAPTMGVIQSMGYTPTLSGAGRPGSTYGYTPFGGLFGLKRF